MSFWQKSVLAAAAISTAAWLPQSAAATVVPTAPAIPDDGVIQFDVYRKGDRIGTHRLTFTQQDELLEVDVDIQFKVKFLFVTVYNYKHQSKEVWSNGRLLTMESATKQNGKKWSLEAVCEEDQTIIEVNREMRTAPPGLLPTSYWNIGIVNQSTLLNTQYGTAIDIDVTPEGVDTVTAMGEEVEALRYNINALIEETGQPVDVDVWYGMDGELMKLRFVAEDGSYVEYNRIS